MPEYIRSLISRALMELDHFNRKSGCSPYFSGIIIYIYNFRSLEHIH